MVRGLVQEQEAGTTEQQLGQRDAHLPATRERLGRPVEVLAREPQAREHRRHTKIEGVAVVGAERVLQVGVAHQHLIVFVVGDRRVAQALLDLGDPLPDGQQPGERRGGLLEQRATLVDQAVLRQVAHLEGRRLVHGPGIGLLETRENAEQRRLARPVWATEANALARRDPPGNVREQRAIAVRLGE